MHYEHQVERRDLSGMWIDVAAALCAGDRRRALSIVLKSEEAEEEFRFALVNTVVKEVTNLCSPNNPSLFRGANLKDLRKFSYAEQHQELQDKSPLLSAVLHAAAESQGLQRNVRKTRETLIPGITTAAGIILNCRSQTMNTH